MLSLTRWPCQWCFHSLWCHTAMFNLCSGPYSRSAMKKEEDICALFFFRVFFLIKRHIQFWSEMKIVFFFSDKQNKTTEYISIYHKREKRPYSSWWEGYVAYLWAWGPSLSYTSHCLFLCFNRLCCLFVTFTFENLCPTNIPSKATLKDTVGLYVIVKVAIISRKAKTGSWN